MAKRTLEFNVVKQRLTRKRDCDFTGLVAGSVGYLQAKFYFSGEWSGCVKAASFWCGDREYPVLLSKNNCCDIPPEVLSEERFLVSLTGAKPGYKIKTAKIGVKQEVQ